MEAGAVYLRTPGMVTARCVALRYGESRSVQKHENGTIERASWGGRGKSKVIAMSRDQLLF
jgi:hypothetical protein